MGHPIISWHDEFVGEQGLQDQYLIPYLGGKQYVWITKDIRAKVEHEQAIITSQISVVWIAGLERTKKNHISVSDLHLMLTTKLQEIRSKIEKSKSPLYFLLTLKTGNDDSGNIPRLIPTTLSSFFKKLS
ncbi:hypothetical protein ABFB09_07970 [Dehalogenimonas sp. THU2]|uniref:hypothetical protein n=1 Tax=Dehalogenimonas sp. THU2 TaxID=3151121 RepID=UPI003218D735